MNIKDLFNFNKKAIINTPTVIPEIWDNQTFYSIDATSQSDDALISMYNELPEVQSPVNYIIDSLSTIPFNHYRQSGKESAIVKDSKVMAIIETPNQFQTENDFVKMFFLNRIMLGTGYINRVMPIGFRTIKQLYILPTQHTTPILLNKKDTDIRVNEIASYETTLGGNNITIAKDQVLVQRETSLIDNNYYEARSRLMSAILTSDSLTNNYEARIKLLRDRGAVAIVSPLQDQTISKEDATKMQKSFYQKFGLTGNKQPVAVLPRGVNVNQIGMNAGELELSTNKTQDFTIICNVLGIDPALFGLGNNTYNNKKLAKTAFYEDTVIPYMDNYLQLLSKVFKLPANEFLKADYSQIAAMQEDYDKIVSSNTKLWNDGLITEKEARNATGFEGGEEKKKVELSGEFTNQNE